MAGRSCSLANARLEPPREVGHLHRGVRGLVAFSTNCVIARPPGPERLVVLTRALPYSPIHSPTGLNERGGRRETAWLMELAGLEPATSWVRSTRSSERETLCLRHFSKERLEGRNISHNISAPDSASAGARPTGSGCRRTPARCSRRTPSRACSASRDATATVGTPTSSSDCSRRSCWIAAHGVPPDDDADRVGRERFPLASAH